MSPLHRALAARRVVVLAGSGGVGKTTIAASLAVGLARDGRRVALITIDPARRLADALGLPWLGNEPERVVLQPPAAGTLDAMMLDAEQTFDGLVRRLARDAAARDAILGNRVYRQLTRAFGGSEAFSAMARLHDLLADDRWEVVVLDTPPARDAQSFLDAPEDLERFLANRALRAVLMPTRRGAALLDRGARVVLPVMRRLTGTSLLEDLRVFLGAADELLGGLHERATAVRRTLRDPSAAFVVVSAPDDASVAETLRFAGTLRTAGHRLAGVVVNRVQPLDAAFDPAAAHAGLRDAGLPDRLATRVVRDHQRLQVLARRDHEAVQRVAAQTSLTPVLVRARPTGVHDVAGLDAVAAELLSGTA